MIDGDDKNPTVSRYIAIIGARNRTDRETLIGS